MHREESKIGLVFKNRYLLTELMIPFFSLLEQVLAGIPFMICWQQGNEELQIRNRT